jgi:hypothetical protein
LILARTPAEATQRQHQRNHRKASRKGTKSDPRSLRSAGFTMLLTSLPIARAGAVEVVRLYRMRWQVELAFQRLKSVGGFADLQASDPRMARRWLLAHLIAAKRIETSRSEALKSPHEHPTNQTNRRCSLWRLWQIVHRRLRHALFEVSRKTPRKPPKNRKTSP